MLLYFMSLTVWFFCVCAWVLFHFIWTTW